VQSSKDDDKNHEKTRKSSQCSNYRACDSFGKGLAFLISAGIYAFVEAGFIEYSDLLGCCGILN